MSVIVNYKGVEIERAEKSVLKGVTFSLSKGEFHYLVGRVGSGKSSLLKTIYADVPVNVGETAEVMGFDLLTLKKKKNTIPETEDWNSISRFPTFTGSFGE